MMEVGAVGAADSQVAPLDAVLVLVAPRLKVEPGSLQLAASLNEASSLSSPAAAGKSATKSLLEDLDLEEKRRMGGEDSVPSHEVQASKTGGLNSLLKEAENCTIILVNPNFEGDEDLEALVRSEYEPAYVLKGMDVHYLSKQSPSEEGEETDEEEAEAEAADGDLAGTAGVVVSGGEGTDEEKDGEGEEEKDARAIMRAIILREFPMPSYRLFLQLRAGKNDKLCGDEQPWVFVESFDGQPNRQDTSTAIMSYLEMLS